MTDPPFPEPCERHNKITWLARVPNDNWRDGQECFGCFIAAKQCEVLEAAAEVGDAYTKKQHEALEWAVKNEPDHIGYFDGRGDGAEEVTAEIRKLKEDL